MKYDAELKFVDRFFNKFRISIRYLKAPFLIDDEPTPEREFRILFNLQQHDEEHLRTICEQCKPNTIYRIHDSFQRDHIMFQLPDTPEPTYAYIGPYLPNDVTPQTILNIANKHKLSPEKYNALTKYYSVLPFFSDEGILSILLYTLGESLWGSMDNFTFQDKNSMFDSILEPVAQTPDTKEPMEPFLSMKLMEIRYDTERELMEAVSKGQLQKAQTTLSTFSAYQMEQRTTDLVRNTRNYAIVLNTLLRKAAEIGAVHPLHIDSLSSRFARKIEQISTEEAVISLMKEMVHKYCLLVKNHSMKGHSLLIRKVITQIDADLTADLSLKTQAELLNVNPSYLSTLFKKETGNTLTEYVNRKRIEHAIFLLNSTSMQIQTIAQYCGIPDVNYFTKTFKKITGKTPKEYRDSIAPYK